MAGTIIADRVQLDTFTDTFKIVSNTGVEVVTANSLGINAESIGFGTLPSSRLPTIPTANMPAGSVLQVVQTVKSDVFSQGGGISDVTGMTVSITPSSASNKVMVMVSAAIGGDTSAYVYVFLFRGSTQIATSSGAIDSLAGTMIGDNQILTSASINFLDSPNTTSSVTYKIQLGNAGSGTAYLNRRGLDTVVTGVSTITVMEIAA